MAALPTISIFGPTGVGKTEVAVQLAELLRGKGLATEAVSADAYAVYRELPIISGSPTQDQRNKLAHAMVGVASVTDEFSAGRFAKEAHSEIDRIRSESRIPIVVGGTGLYLRAALSELDLNPPVPHSTRMKWQKRLEDEGPESLHEALGALDPARAQQISPNDGRRITRALELLDVGATPRSQQDRLWAQPPRHQTVSIGLTQERDQLKEGISDRIDSMVERGAISEVEQAWKLSPSSTAIAAIGMRELRDGDIERMRTRTWQLSKRQMTWLRKLRDTRSLDTTGRSPESVASEIHEFWNLGPSAA